MTGGGPHELCEVACARVPGLHLIAVAPTLLIPAGHGLLPATPPGRVAAPAPVKVLAQVRVSAVLEGVGGCETVRVFLSPGAKAVYSSEKREGGGQGKFCHFSREFVKKLVISVLSLIRRDLAIGER